MIEYVRGILAEKEAAMAAVEAHGVGYEVIIPLSTYERLPAAGAEVKLYTHYYVREDAARLYGFFTKAERELFRRLIAISSIGPRTALGILSKISGDDLRRCVALGDPARLTKIPGIGAKTAQRLIVELRGKLGIPAAAADPAGEPAAGAKPRGIGAEAFEALVSLGYNDKQVARAVERVARATGDGAEMTVEEFIKKALQVI